MQWERVDLTKQKPNLPGLVDIDHNGSTFVSATFKTDIGLFRIRQDGYSTHVEKMKQDTKKVFGVKCTKSDTSFAQSFDTREGAEKFQGEMEDHGFTCELLEDEVVVPKTKADDLPF